MTRRWLAALVASSIPAVGSAADMKPLLRPVGVIATHLEDGGLLQPRGVAIDPRSGEVWVVDAGDGRLSVFSPDGVPLFVSARTERLKEPTRAVVAPNGTLLVLDSDRTTVKVLNYRGDWMGTLSLAGLPPSPSIGAIALDASGRLYVGENTLGRIHVFAPDLTPVLKFGSNGAEEGQFQSIAGIAADADAIYVVDHQVTPVQVFDHRGNLLRAWGKHDMGAANFSLPEAIALDSFGHVVVVDALRHEIKFFDKEGRFLDRFGGYGSAAGNVAFPCDLAVDGSGRLYVAERGGARVQAFEVGEGNRDER